MRDEIGRLTEDLLAALGDLEARGWTTDAPGEPAPAKDWGEVARSARTEGASGAAAMRGVREDLGDCRRCGLCRGRRNIVFGVGDPSADLVVIGEGPGEQEDLRGEPFVGPAGQMLDKMLENVLGLPRNKVYILNVVKCRPPGNRDPKPEEVAACRPFMDAQIRALQPKVGLVLGSVAFKTLFQTNQGIMRNRGRWKPWNDPASELSFPVMPTFHPAYLLRTPAEKRKTFEDLKELRARYDGLSGRR